MRQYRPTCRSTVDFVDGLFLGAGTVLAQTPPAQAPAAPAPAAEPDDTPSIRVGATLFADYTYTQSPEATDADGNTYNPSQFNVGRSYINITGNISHLVAFRFTPDIARETGTGSSLNGSLTFRVKYAYGQVNLDDWMQRGSWVRFGIQQTPWVDFEEGIYRYRFQGQVFSEREGYLSSSDAGASFHYNLPSNYGEAARRRLQRRELQPAGDERPEGVRRCAGRCVRFANGRPAVLRGTPRARLLRRRQLRQGRRTSPRRRRRHLRARLPERRVRIPRHTGSGRR